MRTRDRLTPAHIEPGARAVIWAASTAWPYSREHVARQLVHVPRRFHRAAADAWARRAGADGWRRANLEMLDLGDAFAAGGLDLAASDDEIKAAAERNALEVRTYLGELAAQDAGRVRDRLEKFARASRVALPDVDTLAGIIARMACGKWWRRALRKSIVREVERQAIRLGLVHKRASIYASAEAVARRAGQRRRNARALENMRAENELGQGFTLAELSRHSVSNPEIRRAELMTRISGFESFAQARGDVGMFYTGTAPSRMHARLASTGAENPKFDGSTPRQAQEHLRRVWARARAQMHKKGIHAYGVRVAEPHHDGTPHWHFLLFCRPSYAPAMTAILEKQFRRADAGELSTPAALKARFHPVQIDWERGSAAGYIAAYVAKNIDGFAVGQDYEAVDGTAATATVANVDAWAATWGIRQFQQIGGPGVTIWRELRRLNGPQQLPLFDPLIEAADTGQWAEYVKRMGGIEIRRRDRALNLWRVDYEKENRYGEPAPAAVEGVEHFALELCRTRMHEWRLTNAAVGTKEKPEGNARAAAREVASREEARAAAALAKGSDVQGGLSGGVEEIEAGFPGHDVQRGDRRGVGGLGFALPWTGVNNCNPVEISEACAAWVADYSRASAAPP